MEITKKLKHIDRDGEALAIKSRIHHSIIKNHLSNNTVVCKGHTNVGPVIITTLYILSKRPIISKTDFDILNIHNFPVYVMGDFNENHMKLEDRQTNYPGEHTSC